MQVSQASGFDDMTYSRTAEADKTDENDLAPWMGIEPDELRARLLSLSDSSLSIAGDWHCVRMLSFLFSHYDALVFVVDL